MIQNKHDSDRKLILREEKEFLNLFLLAAEKE